MKNGRFEVRVQAGPSGMSPEGFMVGWSLNVLGILRSLADRLEPAQLGCATDLIEAWGMTLRQLLTQSGRCHVYGPDILPDLRLMFQRGRDLAAKVQAYRGMDVSAVRKAIEYFDVELAEVNGYTGLGDITCESWVFEQVIWHLKDLLAATLGEEVAEYLESGSSEELADILEVVHALGALAGHGPEHLEQLRAAKAAERGGFKERIILKEA